MKSFAHHITEASEERNLCWYLSQDTPKEFYQAIMDAAKTRGKGTSNAITGIGYWYSGDWVYTGKMSVKKDSIKGIIAAHGCRQRSAWANGKGGKLYRGFVRTITEVSKYKYTGETKTGTRGDIWLVATTKYKPKYAAQSWTRNYGVAEEYSFSATGVSHKDFDKSAPVIVMANVPDSETVFSDAVSQKLFQISYLGAGEEHEVVRVSSKPIEVTCYVNFTKWADSVKYRPGETDVEWVLRTFGNEVGMKLVANPKFVKLLPVKKGAA